MAFIDIIIGIIILAFMVSGFKSGFAKKLIGIVCLVLALVLATKFSADVSDLLFDSIGITGRTGFFLSFIIIVLGITFAQSILYKVFLKDVIDSMLNNVLGMFVGLIEGTLVVSISLILLTIFLDLPSQQTKAESELYKPIKNFSPMLFDQINSLLPESEDFYQKMMNVAAEEMKKMEKK